MKHTKLIIAGCLLILGSFLSCQGDDEGVTSPCEGRTQGGFEEVF